METWHRNGIEYSFDELIKLLHEYEWIAIGSDSKHYRHYVKYATVICVDMKPGITFWYSKSKKYNARNDIQTRIWTEVNSSMDTALAVQNIYPQKTIEVHCDINSNPRFASYRFNAGALGYVIGCGFEYRCKPNAWAASDVADWYTK
jgi:predicted RNase H-related nuclease YkuK (DUF458 family)